MKTKQPGHYYVWTNGKRVRKYGLPKEGTIRINNMGYPEVFTRGLFRPEHRIVFEKHLNRKLVKGEVIHHRDGNKLNNRIENLQLLVKDSHSNGIESLHSEDICRLLEIIVELTEREEQ